MNITRCPAPFERYGYDEMGALYKSTRVFSYKGEQKTINLLPWKRLKPANFPLKGGMYYHLRMVNGNYSFHSKTKVFKKVGK